MNGRNGIWDAGFQVSQPQQSHQPRPENPPHPPMSLTRIRDFISDRKPGAGMPVNHSGLSVFEFIDSYNTNSAGLNPMKTLLKSIEASATDVSNCMIR